MIQTSNAVSDTLMEYTALTNMRMMLNDFAETNHIPFDAALRQFTESSTYEALFDYSTGLWKEGPVYLLSFWKRSDENRNSTSSKTTDPFYSEQNQAHLQKSIQELRSGKGQVHNLIEDND